MSGGCGIRTREGLPPTRFPSLLTCIRARSAEYVTWANRSGLALVRRVLAHGNVSPRDIGGLLPSLAKVGERVRSDHWREPLPGSSRTTADDHHRPASDLDPCRWPQLPWRGRRGEPWPAAVPRRTGSVRTRPVVPMPEGITRRGNSWRALPQSRDRSAARAIFSRLTRSGGGGSSSTPWTGGGGSTPRRGRSRSFATSKRGGRTGLGRRNEEGDVTCGPVDDLRRS